MSKKYKKMIKLHKKEIMKAAKKASKNPFDYGFGLEMLICYLEFMRDYYELGENVWGVDNTKLTRLESLNFVLELYDEWVNFQDKYVVDTDNSMKIEAWADRELSHYMKNRTRLPLKVYNKEYVNARNRFFKALSKYIEEWWD